MRNSGQPDQTSRFGSSLAKPARLARWVHDKIEDGGPEPPLKKPTVLQFPVNDICNSRCEMCFIWEQKRGVEVSPVELSNILADPLFEDVRSVGFNGGEPTLRSDLAALVDAAVQSLPSLQGVSVITNALRQRQVLARIQEVASMTRPAGISLDVMVSLDGVGQVHDTVRGRSGNFAAAESVIEALRREKICDSIRIGCTLTESNAHAGQEMLDWAIENDIYARFRVAVPHDRLYNRDRTSFVADTDDARFAICQLLERLIAEYETGHHRLFYRSLLGQLSEGLARTAGCDWRNQGATLFHDGGLGYCAVASPVLGSAIEQNPTELYESSLPVLQDIRETACSGCLHDYEGVGGIVDEVDALLRRRLPSPRLRRTARAAIDTASATGRLAAGVVRSPHPETTGSPGPVLITGWYGTETIGDMAILSAVVDSVHEVAGDGREVLVASLNPYVTRRTCRVLQLEARVVGYDEANAIASTGQLSLAAMAGGPLMASIREVDLIHEVHLAAASSGTPTALLGVGLGPMVGRLRRQVIGQILSLANSVTVRDSASARIAHDLGAVGVSVVDDPAASFVRSSPPSPSAETSQLAVSLRDWPIGQYGGGEVSTSHVASFESATAAAMTRLGVSHQIVPIPMGFLQASGDDRRTLRRITGASSTELRLHSYPTPMEIRDRIAGSSVMLSMRFHAAVFALSLGVPVVALDYTMGGKVAALAEKHPNRVILLDPSMVTAAEIQESVRSAEELGRVESPGGDDALVKQLRSLLT